VIPLQREQIVQAFSAEDRQKLSLPALERVKWANLDFLGWCDRAGDKAFLVYQGEGMASGLVLDRMAVRTTATRAFMCSICRTVHGPRGIAHFTYRSRDGAGYNTLTDTFCGNLQCSLYVRGLLRPDIMQLHETIPVERKIERLLAGIDRFLANISSFDARRRRLKLRVV
jgi:hypothetical protein